MNSPQAGAPRVVIVGGGFGGLYAARALGGSGYDVTLLDKRNFHLFQPLLYQVATGQLTVGDITTQQRVVLSKHKNVRTLMSTAYDLDPADRVVYHEHGECSYETLIVATGVKHQYFGHDDWRPHAPGLKTIEHALEMRHRIFRAFEMAEQTDDAAERQRLMHFVIVGAGPTGVELAGALGELAKRTMVGDFRRIDTRDTRVTLVEAGDSVLAVYDPTLRAAAKRMLEELGVEVRTSTMVEAVGPGRVQLRYDDTNETLEAGNILWAAGVRTSAFGEVVAERTGAEIDRAGRILVNRNLTLPEQADIFVLGDVAHVENGEGQVLPGLAPVAIQQGRYVAKLLRRRLQGKTTKPFDYFDKGTMAVIGRNRAVGQIGKLKLAGFRAWFLWVVVHIWSIIDPEKRITITVQWLFKYFGASGDRLITGDPPKTADIQQKLGRHDRR